MRLRVVNGHIAAALKNANNIATGGGPDKDPAFKHHKHEIKVMLEHAARIAQRLPKKLRAQSLKRIHEIADKFDLVLSP